MAKLFANTGFGKEDITAQEEKVLSALIDGLFGDPGYSDVYTGELVSTTHIPERNIRGVLSSLCKKNYITIDHAMGVHALINLNKNKWYLHPEWVKEYDTKKWGSPPSE